MGDTPPIRATCTTLRPSLSNLLQYSGLTVIPDLDIQNHWILKMYLHTHLFREVWESFVLDNTSTNKSIKGKTSNTIASRFFTLPVSFFLIRRISLASRPWERMLSWTLFIQIVRKYSFEKLYLTCCSVTYKGSPLIMIVLLGGVLLQSSSLKEEI